GAAPCVLRVVGRQRVAWIACPVTVRLGAADVLWSRVSREPDATIAVRPGFSRPPAAREELALAGAWLAAPWPPTMEGAVRSGRAAASMLSEMATKVAVGGVARDADLEAAAALPVQPSNPDRRSTS